MKLRSLIAVSAFALVACGADVLTSTETFGWLKVTSDKAYTIIAVPWLGTDGGSVKVTNLVKTDSLTDGDMLYYYNGESYNAWVKNGSAWESAATATTGGMSVAPGEADMALPRGKALIIYRASKSGDIYLYGQQSTAAVVTTIADGAFNMIANPTATAFDLNGTGKIMGAVAGDIIQELGDTGSGRIYTYGTDGWGYDVETTTTKTVFGKAQTVTTVKRTTTGCEIPAGCGAWYIAKSGSAAQIAW